MNFRTWLFWTKHKAICESIRLDYYNKLRIGGYNPDYVMVIKLIEDMIY